MDIRIDDLFFVKDIILLAEISGAAQGREQDARHTDGTTQEDLYA